MAATKTGLLLSFPGPVRLCASEPKEQCTYTGFGFNVYASVGVQCYLVFVIIKTKLPIKTGVSNDEE